MTSIAKLFDEATIARRVEEIAREIGRSVGGEVTIVGLLVGSFVFVADLVRALDRAGMRPRVAFFRLSSYGRGQKSSGEVRLRGELPEDLAGRRILLVDDITDSGRTLVQAKTLLMELGVTEVWSCTLLDKPSRREVEVEPDFVGFNIEDVFVVGYGIDFADQYRHLPYIGVVE